MEYYHLDDVLSLDSPDDIAAILEGKKTSSPAPVQIKCDCNTRKIESLLEKHLGAIEKSIGNLASLIESNIVEQKRTTQAVTDLHRMFRLEFKEGKNLGEGIRQESRVGGLVIGIT